MDNNKNWQPAATLEVIRQRADLLNSIRDFMQERSILEVETPVLSHAAVTDPHIHSLSTVCRPQDKPHNEKLYLHTSPEFCMKRLLAAGSGPIYQITKVFRDQESGSRHQPEFTILEWYRPGFDYTELMSEIDNLLQGLGLEKSQRQSYRDTFWQETSLDPHTTGIDALHTLAVQSGWERGSDDHAELLDFVFSMKVIPQLGMKSPLFIYDYPVCQAALATIKECEPPVAERFELFISGMEIANGFNELCNAGEQRSRFDRDLTQRAQTGKPAVPVDELFITALDHGLPACAGVAVGLDRLLMALTGSTKIDDVLTFPRNRN
jgi:lysyl-tRNA synthetase class 2